MANPFPFVSGEVLTAAELNGIGEAFTAYSPTVVSTSGSLTTVSATGSFTQVNKLVFARFNITVTNNGTGAGFLNITLPVTAKDLLVSNAPIGVGRENSLSGDMLQVTLNNLTTANIIRFNNNYPAGTGATVLGTMFYEAA